MGGTCNMYGIHDKCIQIVIGKPEGKRPFGRLRRRWKDNIRMDLREIG